MPDPGVSLDAECFHEHVAGFDFREGVNLERWDLHEDEAVQWPNAVVWVAAAPRGESPRRYYLFFNLAHYPKTGPTAYLWDSEKKTKLDLAKWPKGTANVKMVFRTDWNNAVALYCPWDRLAAEAHGEWPAKHPGLLWTPKHTIVNYLRPTHELLNSDEYHGS
jgi:hypothetical protein